MNNDEILVYGSGFTQYFFDKADLEAVLGEYNKVLSEANPPKVFLDTATMAININLSKKPLDYLRYGCYWWAVKKILADNGYIFGLGKDEDSLLLDKYSVKNSDGTINAELTLVAADMFKSFYDQNYFVGTQTFYLGDNNTNQYTLLDEDMESLNL